MRQLTINLSPFFLPSVGLIVSVWVFLPLCFWLGQSIWLAPSLVTTCFLFIFSLMAFIDAICKMGK